VVYKTCVVKAMQSDLISETKNHLIEGWAKDANEPYAIRENFTLFYHNWPFKWETNHSYINLELESLINNPLNTVITLINELKMNIINESKLKIFLEDWKNKNSCYFQIYYDCKLLEAAIKNNKNIDLTYIDDLHDQGYLNYWIETKFNIKIFVWDFKNWFKDTYELTKAIAKLRK